MKNFYFEARKILGRKYGKKFQAFPLDEVQAVDIFLRLNREHGFKLN